MSRDYPANHVPFGYHFADLTSGDSPSSYPPPADRPLLHDEENSFLESFFNNPNSLDTTGLTLMPTDFHPEGIAMFKNKSQPDWSSTSTSDFANPQAKQTGKHAAISDSIHHNNHTSTSTDNLLRQPSESQEPSADVYAAAGILHKNNNTNTASSANPATRPQPDSYNNAFAGSSLTPATSAPDAMNGYTYPPLNPTAGSPYNFDPSNQPITDLYELNPRYARNGSPTPYLDSLQNNLQDRLTGALNSPTPRSTGPLAFGSDDNFRGNYVAPPLDVPEKRVEDTLQHIFSDGSKARQRRAPTAPMRKRARNTQDESGAANNLEDVTYNEDDTATKRRRKDEEDGEAEEEYEDGVHRGPKGKRRQMSATAGLTEALDDGDEPSKKIRPLPSGSKPNRENLTEEQKRSNHIQSEQKRRNLIKQGFDDLNRMVPELRSGSMSKSNMLVESAKFMGSLRDLNEELRSRLQGLDKG